MRYVTAAACSGTQCARLVCVGVGLGQVGLPHVFHQHAPAREQLHQPGDERLQQRVQLVVGGRRHLGFGLLVAALSLQYFRKQPLAA
jgi:hypothetical protein